MECIDQSVCTIYGVGQLEQFKFDYRTYIIVCKLIELCMYV